MIGIALLGPGPEAVLLAGLIYISSSGIISRALFDLRRLADDETDLVLGVLVFEDLAIALFLGVAAALAQGESVGGLEIAGTAFIALAFVMVSLLIGRWAHHAIDRIAPRLDREQLLLLALALAIGGGALGEAAGLSEAVGALLAGILLSGSEIRDQIEQQLLGLRDFAAAIFFFAFGLEVDLGAGGDVRCGCWWRCRSRSAASSSAASWPAGSRDSPAARASTSPRRSWPAGSSPSSLPAWRRAARPWTPTSATWWARSRGSSSWRPRSPGWY